MRRPNLVLSGIVLGLAVLVGCAKKPKTDSVASSTPEQSTSNTAAPAKGPTTSTTTPASTAPAGPSLFAVSADPSSPAPMGGMPTYGMPMGGMPMGGMSIEPMAGAPREIALTQCRFTKVEEALTAAKGKVVFVDCWARWCPPCLASFPKLVEKHEKYGPKGLVCISVSLDAGRRAFNPEQVLAFLKEKNAAFQNFYLSDLGADNAAMEQRFTEISGIPHGVLFNKKGERVWVGHPMDNGLVKRIEAELAK
jgi:thiol-disulfide isomerase/thioredoxin